MTNRKKLKTDVVPIRLSQSQTDLIATAALLLSLSRSEFVRDAALERAQQVIRTNARLFKC